METLQRQVAPIKMRNYGRIIQDMIQVACDEPDETKKRAMIVYIAQCMRQKNLVWNRDQDSGTDRIREDIVKLSNGKIDCRFDEFDFAMVSRPVYYTNNGNNNNRRNRR